MSTEFATNQNKAFLWDFLYKNGMFKNLTSSHENHIKTLFEKEILSTSKTASGENVTNLNKAFISKIVKEIESLKAAIPNPELQKRGERNNAKQMPDIKTSIKYTHQEAAAERQKLFQNNLKETQNNFNEFMEVSKPKEIDFSDKDADGIDANLDSKLAEIVERRKRDMNMVLSSYDTSPHKTTTDNISIGKETRLDGTQIVNVEPKKIKKSVSFDKNNIAFALGKNMEELFEQPYVVSDEGANAVDTNEVDTIKVDTNAVDTNEVDTNEVDTIKVMPDENNVLTVEDFLSRLKTKPISDTAELPIVLKPEPVVDDKETMQTILHEIAGIHETLSHILEIIKK